jgi:hypothetical protein
MCKREQDMDGKCELQAQSSTFSPPSACTMMMRTGEDLDHLLFGLNISLVLSVSRIRED